MTCKARKDTVSRSLTCSTRIITCALAVAGMLFIGSQARAQQIFACVNQKGGVTIVAQNATCPQNETLVVWNVVGPQGTAGPVGPAGPAGPAGPQGPAGQTLAAANFVCSGTLVAREAPYTFSAPSPCAGACSPGTGPVNFGSSISTSGSQFSSIVLQPGVYQIHLDGLLFTPGTSLPPTHLTYPAFSLYLNGSLATGASYWSTEESTSQPGLFDIVGGDVLVNVLTSNTTLQIINVALFPVTPGNCNLNIVQLH